MKHISALIHSAKMQALMLLFIPATTLFSQNLVPNGSFETYSACPNYYTEIENATGWYASYVNNCCTYQVEYLNACGTSGFQVPSNVWGFHYASTGSAYMGQVTMAPSVKKDYRENMYAKLTNPLVKGQTYYVSMKAVHATLCVVGTNNDGVKFSTDTTMQVNNVMAVYADSVISDTANWTTIAGCYTADSAYKYVGVGNFFDDAHTLYRQTCPSCSNPYPGYYVDDISVVPLTLTGDTAICKGDSAVLTASGGASYLWVANEKDTGSVLVVKPGATTVYSVKIINPGCTYIASITVKVDSIPCLTSIQQITTENSIKVYPVPAINFLSVNLSNSHFEPSTIEVYDIAGRKMMEEKVKGNSTTTLTINIADLSQGNYILKLTGENGQRYIKFTVAK